MKRILSVVLVSVLVAGCAVHTASDRQPGPDDESGTVAADVWYVPGKALVCGGAALLSFVTLGMTFGLEYEAASEIMHGGCSGPWFASPQEVRDAARR